MSHDVPRVALKEAERIIEPERLIMPSARDAKMIWESLDHPSQPTASLRAALTCYKGAFGGASNHS